MEKLTEFVSKSFDPTKSALSVQYLAQSAARPDPVRPDTPGTAEADSPAAHDLRVSLQHTGLPMGLPLDLPRYPSVPITSGCLPYPLPLLMTHRPPHLPHLSLHHLASSPTPPSPSSPPRYEPPSPKRHRRSSEDDRRSPISRDEEEDEEVDVEAPDHPEEADSRPPSDPRAAPDGDSSQEAKGHEKGRAAIKLEPSDALHAADTPASRSQDAINNNNNNDSNPATKTDEDGRGRLSPASPAASPVAFPQGGPGLHLPALDRALHARSPEDAVDLHRHGSTPGKASVHVLPSPMADN